MLIEAFDARKQNSEKMSFGEGLDMSQYDKTSSIDAFILINEVRKHEVLYNKLSPEYANVSTREKEKVWELIHRVLFPNYEELSEEIKGVIKITVRKRWKSLRDALVKDHRSRKENPLNRYKKMTPTVKELQFLVPHLNNPRKQDNDSTDDDKHSPEFSKLMDDSTIDLTYQEESEENSPVPIEDEEDMMATNEAFYPSVHLTTSETSGCEDVDWNEGYCISAPDVYTNSIMNYSIREIKDPEQLPNESKKRKRTISEDDLYSKLSEVVDRYNEESHDEDRMFLLSLLSDFKRVPVHKKLKVKSAFVSVLYDALD